MAREFTKKALKALPKYVRMGKGKNCILRLYNPEYKQCFGWRDNLAEYHKDAGLWSVDFRIDEKTGHLFTVVKHEDLQYMNNIRLYPTSEAVWRRYNAGSISKGTKSHY